MGDPGGDILSLTCDCALVKAFPPFGSLSQSKYSVGFQFQHGYLQVLFYRRGRLLVPARVT